MVPRIGSMIGRRNDAIVIIALGLTSGVAWLHLVTSAENPTSMGAMPTMMPERYHWGWTEGLLLFAMWAIMMVAMMLPSAAATILLFARVSHTRFQRNRQAASTTSFVLGYLIVWWIFSALAAAVQMALHSAAILSSDMRASSSVVGGGILIAAGVYQWLPIKRSCLMRCRSPLAFLASEWREGSAGALVMGLRQGAFCVGCCVALMGLLFVAGVMNLLWVAAIAGVVFLEKLLPGGPAIARAAGLLFVIGGAALLLPG